jgi:hypothetical protein
MQEYEHFIYEARFARWIGFRGDGICSQGIAQGIGSNQIGLLDELERVFSSFTRGSPIFLKGVVGD